MALRRVAISLLLLCTSSKFQKELGGGNGLPHPSYRLKYKPRISKASGFTLLNTSSNGAGKLYSISLSGDDSYSLGDINLFDLSGSPEDVGEAYGEILGSSASQLHDIWVAQKLNSSMIPVIDWLWDCSLREWTPKSFLLELEGIKRGGVKAGIKDLGRKVARVLTVSNLPSDTQNIEILVENEIKRHGPPSNTSTCSSRIPEIRSALQSLLLVPQPTQRSTGHCDFFAAWGSVTEHGRLLSSRNLDITSDTGISKHKILTVYRLSGQHAYATMGFAGYFGALGGMSEAGITVSEANLDNGNVSFDGIPWPLRLRELLGQATTLQEARKMWASRPNSAAFNFLVGSAKDAPHGPAAVALETMAGFNGEFVGDSDIERKATFSCVNGTITDGRKCSWPNNGGKLVRIGEPMHDAVFRSNHALHPLVMKYGEPLWNDTVMRYFLLHDRLSEATTGGMKLTAEGAVNITSLLGIKGPDYGSCDRSNFQDSTHVMSLVYDPSQVEAYMAWEDGHAETWTPAACNVYLHVNLKQWFDGNGGVDAI
mmetsp:Transcript_38697/g.62913  ORF Transcript_38697/g.62913 Transcript_38697/m.62913 type:complete len:540 (+) Transcript_38697:82-1701(+)